MVVYVALRPRAIALAGSWLAALLVAANQIVAAPVESATGLVLILAGWPVYLLWVRRGMTPSRILADGD